MELVQGMVDMAVGGEPSALEQQRGLGLKQRVGGGHGKMHGRRVARNYVLLERPRLEQEGLPRYKT